MHIWIGQRIHLGFSVTAYRKTLMNFLDNLIHFKYKIEESNRRGKTRDLFRKTGDINGTLCSKIGTIKDRNSKCLKEEEEIKKRWQEYTEELYKKWPYDLDNHDSVHSPRARYPGV